MPRPGEFPTRANCDPDDPEEFALWAFVALPNVKGAPLIMPVEFYRQVSKHLHELGFRHVEAPEKEWVPPSANDPHWATSPGRWVPAGSVVRSEEDEAREAVAKMSQPQQAALFKVLETWEAGEPLPDTPAGRAVNTLTFAQREVILTVLREPRV